MLFLENEDGKSGDETDGPIQFIKNIVEKVKKDFDGVVVDEEKKLSSRSRQDFSHSLKCKSW